MASNWLGAFGEQWFGAICLAARCDPRKATVVVTGDDYTVHDPSSEIIRVQQDDGASVVVKRSRA